MTDQVQPRHVRGRWLSVLAFVLLIALGGWLLGVRHLPLQTNLLALLPATERNPVAEQAVDHLAGSVSNRVVVLFGARDAAAARAGAAAFVDRAKTSGAFRQIVGQVPAFDTSLLTRFYHPFRFSLLTPADREALRNEVDQHPASQGEDATTATLPALGLSASPFGLTDPAEDPFGWLERWLGQLPFSSLRTLPEDGWLTAHDNGTTWVLVTLETTGSAFDSDVQQRVLDVVTQTRIGLASGVTMVQAGAVFHAAQARAQAQGELHRIGIVATLGIAALMIWAFRSMRILVMGLATIAFGTLAAAVVTLLLFGELHLLTLVFGAALIGETVDYAIQYFVGTAGMTRDEARRALPAIRPALRIALATSVLGYAMLGAVPFPALRQIAVFALAGLLAAWAFVVLALPAWLPARTSALRDPVIALAARWLDLWQRVLAGRTGVLVGVAVLVLSVPGWLRLSADDDVRLLIQRDPQLVAQEQVVAQVTGIDSATQFWLVQADGEEALLRREEQLGQRLDAALASPTPPGGVRAFDGWIGVSRFVPSMQRQLDDRALLGAARFDHPDAMADAMVRGGFRPAFATQYAHSYGAQADGDVTAAPVLRVADWLAWPVSTPLRMLWMGKVTTQDGKPGVASIVRPLGLRDSAAAAQLAGGLPGVTFVDKAGSISSLFARYRAASGLWLGAAGLIVALLLTRRYGWRGGLATFAPTLLASGAVLAAFGYLGLPLTLFAQLGLMLVLGVGVNYAIFLREGELRAGADTRQGAIAVAGTLMSAATTLLSFGLLAFSGMPALHAFGLTLSIGIALSLLLAPYSLRYLRPLDTPR